jgi:putative membrane protein
MKQKLRYGMKTPNAKTFFTENEKTRIREVVRRVEKGTSGEIATMVVDQSDGYPEAEVLGGFMVSGLAALVICLLIHHVTIWSYVPLVILLYFPVRFMFAAFPILKTPFINRKRMMLAVRERGVRAFYERGLYRTRDENGILIFISLLERKVWILGDRGVNRQISQETWEAHARELSDGIRAGRACDSLCRVIEECGRVLMESFPRKEDDTNELPDEMIC